MIQAATSRTSTDNKPNSKPNNKPNSKPNNKPNSKPNKKPKDSSLDDDVTFERMRCHSNKAKFYSVHKQLTWQRQKTLRQFERDHDLATYTLCREKTSMQDRLAKLKEIQRHNQRARQSDMSLTRKSEPTLQIHGILKPFSDHKSHHKDGTQQAGTSSHCSKKNSDPNSVAHPLGNKSAGSLLVTQLHMMTQSEKIVSASAAPAQDTAVTIKEMRFAS